MKDMGFPKASKEDAGLKETEADREVRDGAFRVAAGELRSFIERFEHLAAEKKDIADQQKEVMAEAKG
ncbi:GapR family DNA-binding domain-containing protein, partial [Pseudooceanicola marinus]